MNLRHFRPLFKMTKEKERIANSEFDLSRKLTPATANQLNELSSVLRRLLSTLKTLVCSSFPSSSLLLGLPAI